MYSNVNSVLANTNAAVISITESKIDNSASNAEVGIPCYCILRYDRKRYGGRVACYVGQDLYFNLRSTAMGDIERIFLDIL